MARLMLFLLCANFLNFHFWNGNGWLDLGAYQALAAAQEVFAAGSDLSGSYLSASQCTLAPQDELTYTLRLYNSGNHAASAAVTNQLPAGLELVGDSVTAGGSYDEELRLLSWRGIQVPAGEGISLSFTVGVGILVDELTVIANQATIQAEGQEFTRKVSIALVPEVAPRLFGSYQTVSQTSLAPGEELTYSIHLHNNGLGTAVMDVNDPVPPEFGYIPGSASPGAVYDEQQASLAWNDLAVAPGEERALVFRVKPLQPVSQPRAVINTASIHSGSVTLYRKTAVTLLPEPPVEVQDVQPPAIEKITIGEADVLLESQTTVHILARDNTGVESMFIREWTLASPGLPHWEVAQSSGWVDYQESFAWTLRPVPGVHFIGVWVADRAGNQSTLNRNGMDYASLLLAETEVTEGGYIPYLVYYPAGVDVTATLSPLHGDPDLYAWAPGNPFSPHAKSNRPEGSETLSFHTIRQGTYLFLVHGYTEAAFNLSINPAGGPEGWFWRGEAVIPDPAQDTPAKPGELTDEPVLSQSGLDPLGSDSTLVPEGLQVRMFLPLLFGR